MAGSVLVIFVLTKNILESMSINFRGNYYTLFNTLTGLPILIFLFLFLPKWIKKYTSRGIVRNAIKTFFGVFIVLFSGTMVYECITLEEDTLVIEGVYYEIINDYFVKDPFAFTKKIEVK